MKKRLISILISCVVGFAYFYFVLPPLNIHSFGFWFFIIFILGVYILTNLAMSLDFVTGTIYKLVPEVKPLGVGILGIFVIIMFFNFFMSPLFMSSKYKNRININENVSFTEDVSVVDFKSLALVDKESSQKLGDRVMGQMPELVSQFYVSNMYTQINYKNGVYRVTPLEYEGIIKYLSK